MLHQVQIKSLPAAGSLTLNGSAVNDEQVISAADIAANKLVFTPAAGAGGSGYGNFTYKVHDGLQYSAATNTMKVNIGDSVEVTVKAFNQVSSADVPIKSQTITLKTEAGSNVTGPFAQILANYL